MSEFRQKVTPPTIARRWGISQEKVIAWIKSGELRAINISNGNRRPRYLVDIDDLAAFELKRAVVPPTPPAPRKRITSDIVEYV